MSKAFKDYFSGHAQEYSQYRPKYPAELFSYLASISSEHKIAWDCATGNGQSAVFLTDHFAEVIATDASKTQIQNATSKSGITYQVATAENSHIESNSIDLVTVAQAFHWFDQDAFASEVDRVLKKQGILAIWTYNLLSINPELDTVIHHLYENILGDYWAFERGLVESGYKEVQLPFEAIETPEFQMSTEWNLSQLIGYLCTWSAVNKYQQEQGNNPVEAIYDDILKAWGNVDQILSVRWPLSVKVWRF
ncbi:MAG: class I SAM-dependent methyltransferase [Thiotrichaceae bacterium]